jgi:AraC family transcriptional regulator
MTTQLYSTSHVDFSIQKEVLAILEVARIRLGSSQDAARGAIAEAISALASGLPRDVGAVRAPDTLSSRQVLRINEHIDRYIDQPIGVADLSQIVGNSPAHFARRFKRTLGMTPHAYVMQWRIAFASKLLAETDLAMCDIALRCGFCDQAHFARRFRSLTGVRPTIWRRLAVV